MKSSTRKTGPAQMDYAASLRQVLIRKITRAERDLDQLKLDYCHFVYGISTAPVWLWMGRFTLSTASMSAAWRDWRMVDSASRP